VDYLGNLTQTFVIVQTESFEHRLERAILTVSTQASSSFLVNSSLGLG
jgi:hypothetical protein